MIRTIIVSFLVWMMVLAVIQYVRHASGKQMWSWAKSLGLGLVGGVITGIILTVFVMLF